MFEGKDQINKALVSLVIEKVLLDAGNLTYNKVVFMLNKEYHCYLPDCYEHPEYLNKVFKELFGDDRHVIVQSIKKELNSFSEYKPIARFLEIISH